MHMKTVAGILIALAIGAVCRWFHVPVPAPPTLLGALLVLAVTVGTSAWTGCSAGKTPARGFARLYSHRRRALPGCRRRATRAQAHHRRRRDPVRAGRLSRATLPSGEAPVWSNPSTGLPEVSLSGSRWWKAGGIDQAARPGWSGRSGNRPAMARMAWRGRLRQRRTRRSTCTPSSTTTRLPSDITMEAPASSL